MPPPLSLTDKQTAIVPFRRKPGRPIGSKRVKHQAELSSLFIRLEKAKDSLSRRQKELEDHKKTIEEVNNKANDLKASRNSAHEELKLVFEHLLVIGISIANKMTWRRRCPSIIVSRDSRDPTWTASTRNG